MSMHDSQTDREETTVCQFDELSETAKDRARDWYRQASADDFMDFSADSVIDDAARIFELFGLTIRTKPVKQMNGSNRMDPDVYWDLGNGGGASVSGSYSYAKQGRYLVGKEAPAEWRNADGSMTRNDANAEINRIVRELGEVQRRNFYQVQATLNHNHGRHVWQQADVERADDRLISDADAETVLELLRDAAAWLHTNLQREEEYQSSDDVIDENIRANEYEFNEDGERA